MEKRCNRCNRTLPASSFYKRSRSSDGLQAYCRQCSLASVKRYQARIGKSVIHRSVKYGLKPDEVRAAMSVPQCQSCGAEFSSSFAQKFDHCHDGGHFRGVLCHLCNMACAGTSDEVIARAKCIILYCERDKERHEQTRAG